MMFGNRLCIKGELTLKSDLHIGSGQTEKIARRNRDDQPETSELALVQRDHKQLPLIPSTALKGALRADLRRRDPTAVAAPFGEISEHEKDKGTIGRLWVEPATWLGGKAIDADKELLAPPDAVSADAFRRTRVALDKHRGAAAHRMLFTEEIVRKGARFAFRATWLLGRERGPSAVDEQLLIAALAPLHQGIALGRDTRNGQGRIKLDVNSLAAKIQLIDGRTGIMGCEEKDQPLTDRLVAGMKTTPRSEAAGDRWNFILEADTPFISIGDHRKKAVAATEDGESRETVAPLMRDGKPMLWPSSLLGALRARALWLVACARLRAEAAGEAGPPYDADEPGITLKRADDAAALSSIERLFGVAGWRGELEVEKLEASLPAERQYWTSVSIDRFTGGGRDSFLYTSDTFIEPTFTVTLHHRPRIPGLDDMKAEADRQVIELLIHDMKENGIMLGHGAAKGFGWFSYRKGTV